MKEKELTKNKYKKQIRKQKGITLVALVITVVVMLILAGVAIAAVVDGDGLFSKTRQATETYENATRDEGDTIQSMINQIDEYLGEKNPPTGGETIENPINQIVNVNQTYSGGTTGSYSDPIIPKGFKPVGNAQDSTITEGAEWGSKNGYQYGLVIQDESGNQFVWVPVDGTTVKFERYDFGKMNSSISSFDDLMETVPEAITTSVTNNGGFYIARYEAGKLDGVTLETNGSVRPVSKQGVEVWDEIAWSDNGTNDDTNPGNGIVTVARSMYPEEDINYGVVSTLIYGIQWDTALKFIGAYDTGEAGYDTYALDSTGMGNYNDKNEYDEDLDGFSNITTCGAAPEFRQKNIYDMAGNVYEWTMEKYSDYRINRGGAYNFSGLGYSVSRRSYFYVDSGDSGLRFPRSTLYKVNLSINNKK